ncbi:MAG: hypothetical protein HPY80_10360 [Bacteroidales bacterium]|nr:hypothetical protein [Bacteroidales bacterium]
MRRIHLILIWLYLAGSHAEVEASGRPFSIRLAADDTIPFDSCHQARPVCGVNPTWYIGGITNGGWDECMVFDPITGAPDSSCIYYCQMEQGMGGMFYGSPLYWFFRPLTPGKLVITAYSLDYAAGYLIEHGLFEVFGPYSYPTSACLDSLDEAHLACCPLHTPVLPDNPDTCIIENVVPGKYYLIISAGAGYNGSWTNPLPVEFRIEQLNIGQPDATTLDCGMVYNCTILDMTTVPGSCNPQTNTFGVSGRIYFTNPPATGLLVVWDDITGSAVTFHAPFESPVYYSLNGLPCDNLIHVIHSAFWDSTGCEYSVPIQAPVLCPQAVMSGGGGTCDISGAFVPVYVHFPVNATLPYTFIYSLNGVAQQPITTSGPFPYIIQGNSAGLYQLDSCWNIYCGGEVSGQAIVEFYPLPQPDLGPDITTCEGKSVTLDAGAGYVNYQWSTGDNTRWIEVYKSGAYQVWVIDLHQCEGSDTIEVNFVPKPLPLLIKHN